MYRIAHISDLHLSESKRWQSTIAALRLIEQTVFSKPYDIIAVTGDLAGMDAPHHMTMNERLFLADWFRSLSSHAPVIIIRGNHDRQNEVHIFSKCGTENKITAVDSLHVEKIEVGDGSTVAVVCLPWMPIRSVGHDLGKMRMQDAQDIAAGRIKKRMKAMLEGHVGPSVAFAHLPVLGASVGSFEIESVRDILLPPDFFNSLGFDYVGLGHIHQAQAVAKNAWYAGSPYPITFGESLPKGFLDVEVGERNVAISMVEIPSWQMITVEGEWDGKWKKYPLSGVPKDILREGAYVRLVVQLPDGASASSLPLSDIQMALLADGANMDLSATKIIRKSDHLPISMSKRPNGKTVKQRLYEAINEVEDEGRRHNLLVAFEEIMEKQIERA